MSIQSERVRKHIARTALSQEPVGVKALSDVETISNLLRIHKSNYGSKVKRDDMSSTIVEAGSRGVAGDVLSVAMNQLMSLISGMDLKSITGNVIALLNLIGQKIAKYKDTILKATNDGYINFFKLSPATVSSIQAIEDTILTAVSEVLQGVRDGDVTKAKSVIDEMWPDTVTIPRSIATEDAAFEQRNAVKPLTTRNSMSYTAVYCMSSPCASIYDSRAYDDGSIHSAVRVRTPITVISGDSIPLTQIYVSDNISTFVNEDQAHIIAQRSGTYSVTAEISLLNSKAAEAYVLPTSLGLEVIVNGRSADNQVVSFQVCDKIQTHAKLRVICYLAQNDKLEIVNRGSNITFGDGYSYGSVEIVSA